LALVEGLSWLRRRRERQFSKSLFAEPCWGLLLELMSSEERGKLLSVKSACISMAIPTTSALRLLRQLEQSGYVRREPDPKDNRRVNVRLSPGTMENLRSLFEEMDKMLRGRRNQDGYSSAKQFLLVAA
jgi:DNA-binding MarR family transcriptional regulator